LLVGDRDIFQDTFPGRPSFFRVYTCALDYIILKIQ
jgi:hypothetical protein